MSTTSQPPRGMRDFLPDDVRRREFVIGVIESVYQRYGFEPLETPAVENLETLTGKYGEEGNQLIFKILKRGEHEASGQADLALRYDLTVPLARVVAQYRQQLPRFFKRYQIQPVWRADRPARGRFREFYQCDVDVLGSTSPLVEAELCGAAAETLERLGFGDFVIRLNHRHLLTAILDWAGIEAPRHADALVALDKLDKIGRDGVANDLAGRGVSTQAASRLLDVFARPQATDDPSGGHAAFNRRALGDLDAVVGEHERGGAALANLRQVIDLAESTVAAGRVKLDLSLARGLSYYTGAIMEISVPDLAGSLGGGGRYDNLVGMFLGEDVPACGLSLGLERIIVVMGERGMFPASVGSAAADVMVTVWSDATLGDALALAREFRAGGVRVDVYPQADKLGKQVRYAATRGVRFVAIAGDDERARGEVTIKDLTTGEQRVVARRDVRQAVTAAGTDSTE